ncbi:MAG TPA: hypothetical protein VK157_09135 [Phycisphaerales bacterium]|nr:hypothetical protein [Phycisphaerales bacterium]
MDWTFSQVAWSSLGLLVAAAGLALLIRGGVRWRTQGEKPCTCGYDLAHSPIDGGTVQCAECGVKVPVARIVAKHPRRWKLVLAGVTLLLLGEPVWRVQHVTDATGAKNWMAVVPTWVLAGVWPVPKPVADDHDAWTTSPPLTRRVAYRGYAELDRRLRSRSLSDQEQSISGNVYARRSCMVWDGVTVMSTGMTDDDPPTPQQLHVLTVDRVFLTARRDGSRWSEAVRQFANHRYPGNERDESLAGRIAAPWEDEVFEIVWNLPIRQERIGMLEPQLSVIAPVATEVWGGSILVFTTDDGYVSRVDAWRKLNEFYTVAGPEDDERLLAAAEDSECRAYWVGDLDERKTADRMYRRIPIYELVGMLHQWLLDQDIRDGEMFASTIDPTGEILVLDGDARMQEHTRRYLRYLRETQSTPK